tara:strand:+ start:88 stop:543 length:456 start_codon:yes stop_codon:yes gene_type:complete
MVSIYLIEDINDLKYVGSTTMKLNKRLTGHRGDKKIGKYCSSSELNLDNCMIIELDHCNLEDRKEREQYWINKIDCVNIVKLNGRDKDKKKEYNKEYREKNKEKLKEKKKEYDREYREKNKDKLKEYLNEYREKNKDKLNEYKREYRRRKR